MMRVNSTPTMVQVCGTEGCLSFIDQTPSLASTTVKYLEFAPGAWRPRYPKPREFSVGGFTRFADFAITPKWLVPWGRGEP